MRLTLKVFGVTVVEVELGGVPTKPEIQRVVAEMFVRAFEEAEAFVATVLPPP